MDYCKKTCFRNVFDAVFVEVFMEETFFETFDVLPVHILTRYNGCARNAVGNNSH